MIHQLASKDSIFRANLFIIPSFLGLVLHALIIDCIEWGQPLANQSFHSSNGKMELARKVGRGWPSQGSHSMNGLTCLANQFIPCRATLNIRIPNPTLRVGAGVIRKVGSGLAMNSLTCRVDQHQGFHHGWRLGRSMAARKGKDWLAKPFLASRSWPTKFPIDWHANRKENLDWPGPLARQPTFPLALPMEWLACLGKMAFLACRRSAWKSIN